MDDRKPAPNVPLLMRPLFWRLALAAVLVIAWIAYVNWPDDITPVDGSITDPIKTIAASASATAASATATAQQIVPAGDRDGDGLSDDDEVNRFNTDPDNPDTDSDGLPDNEELALNIDPRNNDWDGDGLLDGEEVNQYGTDPRDPDTDGDKGADGDEVSIGTDPNNVDTDGDKLTDHEEISLYNTIPTDPDTDGDGVNDYDEVMVWHTDPLVADPVIEATPKPTTARTPIIRLTPRVTLVAPLGNQLILPASQVQRATITPTFAVGDKARVLQTLSLARTPFTAAGAGAERAVADSIVTITERPEAADGGSDATWYKIRTADDAEGWVKLVVDGEVTLEPIDPP